MQNPDCLVSLPAPTDKAFILWTDFSWKSGGDCYEGFTITHGSPYMEITEIPIYGHEKDNMCMGMYRNPHTRYGHVKDTIFGYVMTSE